MSKLLERIELSCDIKLNAESDVPRVYANQAVLEGYALVYGNDIPRSYGTLVLQKGSATKTLESNPHILGLFNHEGMPFSSTRSDPQTLLLKEDDHGVFAQHIVNRDIVRVNDMVQLMEDGIIDGASAGFGVVEQEWLKRGNENVRVVSEISLHRGDMSIVDYGGNIEAYGKVRLGLNTDEIDELRALINKYGATKLEELLKEDAPAEALEEPPAEADLSLERQRVATRLRLVRG